jgi:hypothetical protein
MIFDELPVGPVGGLDARPQRSISASGAIGIVNGRTAVMPAEFSVVPDM